MLKIKNKKVKILPVLIAVSIIIIIFIIFQLNFSKNNYKNQNNGNNISNKTLEEVEQYILNINSYKAVLNVTIKSNKNTNQYIIKQTHNKEEDIQEVLEPESVKGIKIIYKSNKIEIQNTKLNVNKIYNNYPYVIDNNLWLNSFIEDYKNTEKENKEIVDEEEIIKIVIIDTDSKIKQKELYIDKKTGNPTKLLLKEDNKNTLIYILYSEIELNK